MNLAEAVRQLEAGNAEKARSILLGLLRRSPGDADLNTAMAASLERLGQGAPALYYREKAAQSRPADASLWLTLARSLNRAGKPAEAIEACRKATLAQPREPGPWVALSEYLWAAQRPAEARAACEQGLGATGGAPALLIALAYSMQNAGRADEAVALLRTAIAQRPDDYGLRSALAVVMNYAGGVSAAEVFEAHRACGQVLARLLPVPLPPAPPRPGGGRLRVGFISPDFRLHSVAFFVEPIVEFLDRERFEVVCIQTNGDSDAVTQRFKAKADGWLQYLGLREEDFAAFLRSQKFDILVELSGHFEYGRLPALHLRPARVQATYCGYPNTTGIPAIGWRIVDHRTDPAPRADALAVERLARLEGCFLCYRPPEAVPEVAPLPPCQRAGAPGDPAAGITFGSFNALSKLNDRLIGVWARVLAAAPGSTLALKAAALADATVRGDVADRFARAGVEAQRLQLWPPIAGAAAHLSAYDRLDIALDTFPYNGTTTTCEALLMGVPVVALAGQLHAGRVGVSLLTEVGLADLIARTEDEYIALAAALAADPARLAVLRRTLRQQVLGSGLCDGPGLARRFGEALWSMWQKAG